ncbi:MAG: hypothetical protein OCD02_21875 [Spirochaetaceae bacterium]
MKRKFIFSIIFCLTSLIIYSDDLPDFSDLPEIPMEDIVETSDDSMNIIEKISYIQNDGFLLIDKQLKGLKNGFKFGSLLIIILFSFAYGVLHTLGPGHGKMIIFSYFLSEETTKWDTLALSILIPIIHSTGAVLLAVLLKTVLSFITGFDVLAIQYSFTMLSGLLIVGISLYLIFKSHKHHKVSVSNNKNVILRNIPVAVSVGIVPCPLSLTIMSTSIIYGIFWIGFSAVMSLTIAMTIVLYFIALIASKSQKKLNQNKERKLSKIFHSIGETLLLLIGLMFIYNGGRALWPILF